MQFKDFGFSVFTKWVTAVEGRPRLAEDFVAETQGPRVFLHDFAHIVCGGTFRLKGEEATAITQAVLLRDLSISESRHKLYPEAERALPSFSEFNDAFFARIREVYEHSWTMVRPGEAMPSNLVEPQTTERRKFYYDLAVEFDRLFEEKFGRPVYKIHPNQLAALDAREVVSVAMEAWANKGHNPRFTFTDVIRQEYAALPAKQAPSKNWRVVFDPEPTSAAIGAAIS